MLGIHLRFEEYKYIYSNPHFSEPVLRPKGLGLGATKMINEGIGEVRKEKEDKELKIVKGAFVKIIAGQHKGKYCEVS